MLELWVALLASGAALLVAEAHLVSYGVLGVTGLAAMVLGAVLAVDAGGGLLLIIAIALMLGLAGGTVLIAVVRRVAVVARRRPRTGAEGLVGRVGVVRSPPGTHASVFVDGELWRAKSSVGEQDALRVGDCVVVERVSGLTLAVRHAEEWELDP